MPALDLADHVPNEIVEVAVEGRKVSRVAGRRRPSKSQRTGASRSDPVVRYRTDNSFAIAYKNKPQK